MRGRINFILKVIALTIIMFVFSFNAYTKMESFIRYNISNERVNLLWWGTSKPTGSIILSEESIEINYGNEDKNCNIWCAEQDRYAVGIYSSTSPELTVTSQSENLSFEFGDGEDIDGNPIKILYIIGVDKEPANSFYDGTYNPTKIIITCGATEEYAMGMAIFNLYVFPKEVTEINLINENDLVYNGEKQFPKGEPANLINGDECGLLFEGGGASVGDRQAKLIGLDNTNYYLSDSIVNTMIEYYINPAPLTITPMLSLTYGEMANANDVTYLYEGLAKNDTFNTRYINTVVNYNQFDPIYDENGNKIEYEINSSIYDYEGNYEVTFKQGLVDVKPAPIDVEYNAAEITLEYGDELDLSQYCFSNPTGLLNDDTIDSLGYELNSNYVVNNDVYDENGQLVSYTLGLESKINNNYYISTNPIVINVVPKEVVLKFKNTTVTYTGYYQKPEVVVENLVDGDTCNVLLSDSLGRKEAGEYTIYAIGLDNKNYKLVGTPSCTFIINKANVDDFEFNGSQIEYRGTGYIPTHALPLGIEDVNYVITQNGTTVDEIINVGSYEVTAIYTVNSNYNTVEDKTATVVVKPKKITAKLDKESLTYTGSEQTVNVIFEGLVAGDELEAIIDGNTKTDVNEYNVNVEIKNGNYLLEVTTYQWAIEPKAIEFNYSDVEIEYNGLAYDISHELPEGVEEINYSITLNGQGIDEIKNAGIYTVALQFILDDNYCDNGNNDDKEYTVTVKPKEITVTFEIENTEFTGDLKEVEVKLNGVIEGDIVTPIIEGNTGANIGDYEVKVSIENLNYILVGQTSYQWHIEKATIAHTKPSDITKTYDGKAYELPVINEIGILNTTYEIKLNNEIVTEIKNAGIYTVVISYEVDSSYYDLASDEITITIEQRELTASFKNITVTYTGYYQKPEVVVENLVDGDTCNVLLSDSLGRKEAGEYTIYAIGLDNKNYKLVGTPSCTFIINKANVDDFEFNGSQIEYRGTGYIPTHALPLGIEDVNYVITQNGTTVDEIINVGSYEVTAIYTVNSNYNTVEDKIATVVVKPKEITVVLDFTKLTYTGSEQSVNVTFEGLVDGDDLNATIEGNKGTAAGEYTPTVTFDNINYVIKGEMPKWNINRKDVDYTYPNNMVSEYNGLEKYLPTELPEGVTDIKYTITLNGETVSEIKNAGVYSVKAEYITDSNYNTIKDHEFTVTIEPKELTLTFEFVDSEYTGENKDVNVTFNGIIEGDDVLSTITGNTATNVGDYQANVSINNPNYVIKGEASYDWSIEKAYVNHTKPSDITKTYDGKAYELPVINEIGILNTTYEIKLNNEIVTEIKNAGIYTVVISYEVDSSYYDLASDEITITINRKKLSVVFGDNSKVFNNKEQSLSVLLVGVIEGDSITLDITGATAKDVGSYEAKVISIDNTNYYIDEDITYDWEITKVPEIEDLDPNGQNQNPNLNNKNKESKDNFAMPIITLCTSLGVLAACFFIFKIKIKI